MSGIMAMLLAGGVRYTVVETFNATGSWVAPTGVTSVDYLCILNIT